MTTVDFYSKGQTDALLSNKADTTALPTSSQLVPSTSGASSGDVLTFDGSSVGWSAGGGGGGGTSLTTKQILQLFSSMCHISSDYGNSVRGKFIYPSDTGSDGWQSVECVSRTGVVSTPSDISVTFMNIPITITFFASATASANITFTNGSSKVQGLKYIKLQPTCTNVTGNTTTSVITSVSNVVSYYDD